MPVLNILITGATGFIGSYLTERYARAGEDVFASVFDLSEPLFKVPNVQAINCDIRNQRNVENLVELSKPDIIYHLAAQTYIQPSWEDPINTYNTNIGGTVMLLEAIKKKGLKPTVVVACSSAEYGETANSGKALAEEDPLLPITPYGISKVGQDMVGYQYFQNFGLRVLRARIFNTVGPKKNLDFVADMSQQLARIALGNGKGELQVGNLNSKRDLSSIDDTVEGLVSLASKGKDGDVYNICTGKAIRIGDLLSEMLRIAGVDPVIKIQQSRIRTADESIILGDNSKMRKQCSWQPKADLNGTLRAAIEYWKRRMASNI